MVRYDVALSIVDPAPDRAALVRLCARLTGDPDAAEDLAQETMIAAWRHERNLRDPDRRAQWLGGIARNVCANWRRRQGTEAARRVRSPVAGENDPGIVDLVAAGVDLEEELERAELAQLLDRALALLPPLTRQVLLGRYVAESPQAEVARRLGLSEGAVAMKLQRGKLAMRRVLATELREAALAYGLAGNLDGVWQRTRLWCPLCGHERMQGRFLGDRAGLQLRCPGCCPSAAANVATSGQQELFRGVHGFRAAYERLLAWDGACAAPRGPEEQRCPYCGGRMCLQERRSIGFAWWGRPSFRHRCTACSWHWDFAMSGLLLTLPAGRRFRREHPRLRSLPVRTVEREGRPHWWRRWPT